MRTNNLNYAFNVEYYEKVFEICERIERDTTIIDKNKKDEKISEEIKNVNRDLTNIVINNEDTPPGTECFKLQVAYPGLLVGTGNAHDAGKKGEICLGFTFDYVTGSPYIPGSSIKGVLRSAFAHEDYIDGLLGNKGISIKDLKEEIFEGKKNGKEIPVPLRDTFYDSFPTINGRLIALEAITPHKSATESPNPLTLVKVKPNVTFLFAFKLHDGLITAQEKHELFKNIIKDLGLGAKTNVGFGVFTEPERKFTDTPTDAAPRQNNRQPRRDNNSRSHSTNNSRNHNQGHTDSQDSNNRNNTSSAPQDDTKQRCESCNNLFEPDLNSQIWKMTNGEWLCGNCLSANNRRRRN